MLHCSFVVEQGSNGFYSYVSFCGLAELLGSHFCNLEHAPIFRVHQCAP